MERGADMGQQLDNEDALSKVLLLLVVQIALHGGFRGPSLLFQLSTKGELSAPKLWTGACIPRQAAEFARKAQGYP